MELTLFPLDLGAQFNMQNKLVAVRFSLAGKRELLHPAPESLMRQEKQSQELKHRRQHMEGQNGSVLGDREGKKSKRTKAFVHIAEGQSRIQIPAHQRFPSQRF